MEVTKQQRSLKPLTDRISFLNLNLQDDENFSENRSEVFVNFENDENFWNEMKIEEMEKKENQEKNLSLPLCPSLPPNLSKKKIQVI